MHPEVQRHRVDGVELAVEIAGQGTPLLLVHGYPLDRTIWHHPLHHLRGILRIAPDLRGFGQSESPAGGASMATYAGDLVALLDRLRLEQVTICGLSMGGYIVFEMLRQHRDRINGLVLVATRAGADTPEARAGRDQAAALARDRGISSVTEAMLPRLLAPGSYRDPRLVDRVRAIIERASIAGIIGALGAMRDRPDSTGLLEGLQGMPALIVAGDADQLIPQSEALAMRDAIPGAQWSLVPSAGHLVPMEQPAAFTRALQAFLAPDR
jgi:3-oxoadipate enol-lactonase